MPTLHIDSVVIGAGIVGLACARALAATGRQVVILEAETAIGTQLSSRNSEVIHGGLYYPPDSLKAATCVRGNALLYDFCEQHKVAYRRCGKLVVANAGQEGALQQLLANARAAGATGLSQISQPQLCREEPWLNATSAIHSANTGIVDSLAVMATLLADAEMQGAMLCLQHRVDAISCAPNDFTLQVATGTDTFPLRCNQLINATGLGAVPLVNRMHGFPTTQQPSHRFAKGNYFALQGESPTSRLIYPLPESHGLGVHLTLDLAGNARFGPDVEWVDNVDYCVNTQRRAAFVQTIQSWWPDLPAQQLVPDYAGIRPKLYFGETPYRDFLIQDASQHGIAGLVNLLGIESPGLTAALALAERVKGQ